MKTKTITNVVKKNCKDEFSRNLGSIFLSFYPLRYGSSEDKNNFRKIVKILNNFVKRHRLKPLRELARLLPDKYGRPRRASSLFSIFSFINYIWHEFGIGNSPEEVDYHEIDKLKTVFAKVLYCHKVATVEFRKRGGKIIGVKKFKWKKQGNESLSLREIL